MLRIATEEDIPLILGMSTKFIQQTNYKDYAEIPKIKTVIEELINSDTGVIILHSDKGMIAGVANPFIFGSIYLATELAWWVEPQYRKEGVGEELLEAFEYWAGKLGCRLIAMMSLDESLSKYYEQRGYVLSERTYFKEL